jgi:hypothetical protein
VKSNVVIDNDYSLLMNHINLLEVLIKIKYIYILSGLNILCPVNVSAFREAGPPLFGRAALPSPAFPSPLERTKRECRTAPLKRRKHKTTLTSSHSIHATGSRHWSCTLFTPTCFSAALRGHGSIVGSAGPGASLDLGFLDRLLDPVRNRPAGVWFLDSVA